MDRSYSRLPHSHQKTGGLFDEGFASDTKHVTGNDTAIDLLTAIDNGSDILTLDNMDNFNSFAGIDPFNDASLDSFVDLSEYLMEKSTPVTVAEVTPDTVNTNVTVSVDDGTSVTSKRTWEEIVEFVDSTEQTNPTSPDHDYSTKRPRLTSSSNTDSITNQPSTSSTTDKYKVRREKNNIASKRSRQIRKNKFTEMEEKAEKLVVQNEEMRERIVLLEALAKEMKATLVAKLAGK